MDDQMVEFDFQVKDECWHFAKNETQPDMFVKGAISTQNSKLLTSLSLTMRCELYSGISAVVYNELSFQIFKF